MQNSTSLAWLIGDEGAPGEIRFELTKSESTIGRGADCEVQVDDKLASRKHAVIYHRDGGFYPLVLTQIRFAVTGSRLLNGRLANGF